MWFAIIGALLAVSVSGLLFISFRSARFRFVRRLTHGSKGLARLCCLGFWFAVFAILWLTIHIMNAMVCMVHLVLFWLLCDLGGRIVNRIRGQKTKRYRAGAVAILLCALYLAGGWYAVHHVWEKDYSFETEKLDGSLRIVQITDSHLGTTFDAAAFSEYIEQINALSPDVVVVTGDFVDDDTSREDMLGGCDALGGVRAKYGVFLVFGNHDRGYYSEASRGWTGMELRERLEQNGVNVLEDEIELVDGRFYIVGRIDRSGGMRGGRRMTAQDLLAGLDRSKYILLLDHQPADFDAEAEAGADLVLCGHTHGGQFIPINHVGEWMGENCLRYGYERRLDTDFIVSSGISNWAFRFKTGCHSEYVVIDLNPAGANPDRPQTEPSGTEPELPSGTPGIETQEPATEPPETEATESAAPETAPPVEDEAWKLILVNADHPIPEDYSITLKELRYGQRVDERMYPELQQMFDDARALGIHPLINESYRTRARQQEILDKYTANYEATGLSHEEALKKALETVAVPGTSEHELGLALDIIAEFDTDSTATWEWLAKNAWRYGFILRYPADKTELTGISYEPWHFRYVGKEAAKEITERGICLEEYVQELG